MGQENNKEIDKLNSFKDPQNGKYGFIDKTGKIVITPKFDRAESFSNGLAKVNIGAKWVQKGELGPRKLKREGKWGLIDKTGRIVCKPRFDFIGSFSEGLASVKKGGKYGYIDKTGEIIIKLKFAYAGEFSDGKAPAQKVKLAGYLYGNYFAKVVSVISIIFVHENPKLEMSDLFGGRYGYIDKSGKFVIKPQFNWAGCFSEGLALVEVGRKWGRTHGKYGYIDKTGKFIINPLFDSAETFCDGRAKIEWQIRGHTTGWRYRAIIDTIGNIVVAVESILSDRFSEGLAYVDIGNKYGYVNKIGKFVIEPKFDDAGNFSEGLARVNLGGTLYYESVIGGQWGFIDKSGALVIEPQFASAEDFSNGVVKVNIDGRTFRGNKVIDGQWVVIDKTGKVING